MHSHSFVERHSNLRGHPGGMCEGWHAFSSGLARAPRGYVWRMTRILHWLAPGHEHLTLLQLVSPTFERVDTNITPCMHVRMDTNTIPRACEDGHEYDRMHACEGRHEHYPMHACEGGHEHYPMHASMLAMITSQGQMFLFKLLFIWRIIVNIEKSWLILFSKSKYFLGKLIIIII